MKRHLPVILATVVLTLITLYPWILGQSRDYMQWQLAGPVAWGAVVVYPLFLRITRPDADGNRILLQDRSTILQRVLQVSAVVVGTMLANNFLLHTRGEPPESGSDFLDILGTAVVVVCAIGLSDRCSRRTESNDRDARSSAHTD